MLTKEIGEFGLIKRISTGLGPASRPVIAGIGDDAAALHSLAGKLQLVTTDMLVEDVHFRTTTSEPFQIGWKSMAANISDIAAMGGEPTYAFVSIGLTRQTTVEFVDGLYSGMKKIAEIYSVDIVGGDTVSAPQLIINIALLGEVEPENLVRRSGAKVGDAIMVTGDLGGSDAGLAILERNLPLGDTKKHLMPIPRVREGRLLAQSGYVTSMIDISDGLASEVHHICEMSGTGARVYMKNIPLSDNVRQVSKYIDKSPYDFALYGGEDYELLFTCQPDKVQVLAEKMLKDCGTLLTNIGQIVDILHSIIIEDESGKTLPLAPRGYNHFAPSINPTDKRVEEIAPSGRKVLGCYMYDYGNGKPMPLDLMKLRFLAVKLLEKVFELWKSSINLVLNFLKKFNQNFAQAFFKSLKLFQSLKSKLL